MTDKFYLGIDTSNYRTSVAVCNGDGEVVASIRRLLKVGEGERGLRQSDALFQHTVSLPGIMEELGAYPLAAVGYSAYPRDIEGSYMPCFLAGAAAARSIAAANGIPCHRFSHQAGHIRAAAYSCGGVSDSPSRYLAFHVSGGTTELLLYENGKITLLGATRDINAGQLIDRVGVAMGMRFPCGEELEALTDGMPRTKGIRVCVNGFDCNLSGIENQATARLKGGISREEVAAFTLDAVLKTIERMSENAILAYPDLPILYAGGVMSCSRIKAELSRKFKCYFATPEYSGDNATGTALLTLDKELGARAQKSTDKL
ncbi:MAG: peptidase M22 [Clostridia bacterium]|nr:peptidase M22 [Clostridia bacterium]